MRILYFHQYFTTPDGANGTRSYEMAKHLVEKGHKVTMVYALNDRAVSPLNKNYVNGIKRGVFEGIDLIELDLNYSNKLSFLQRTWVFLLYSLRSVKLIFTEEYDLIYATTTPLTAGIPGIIAKLFRPKKKFVFEVRDLWPELPKAMGVITNPIVLWLMDVLETISYYSADACVALSPGIKQGIEKKVKTSKPIELVPNACDLELFKPGKSKKSFIDGCNENDFIAIFTGAHGFANGLDAALDAAKIVQDRNDGKNIKFVFIGDGAKKVDLIERTEKEQIKNCVFIDPVPKKKLVEFLRASDIGLMLLANVPAFYYGTSPNKFFDYISVGLPVLTNYPGWLAEMIKNNNLGVVVPPDNPELFADALIKLKMDKERVKFMGINARRFAEKQFNRKVLAEKLEQFLIEVSNK